MYISEIKEMALIFTTYCHFRHTKYTSVTHRLERHQTLFGKWLFLCPFSFLFFFLKISFANHKDNNAPKKQAHHVIRKNTTKKKKKSYYCQGEGGLKQNRCYSRQMRPLSGCWAHTRVLGRWAVCRSNARPHARTANHSVVSTSSHDAPLSGRLRQSNTVGLSMHKYWAVCVMKRQETLILQIPVENI